MADLESAVDHVRELTDLHRAVASFNNYDSTLVEGLDAEGLELTRDIREAYYIESFREQATQTQPWPKDELKVVESAIEKAVEHQETVDSIIDDMFGDDSDRIQEIYGNDPLSNDGVYDFYDRLDVPFPIAIDLDGDGIELVSLANSSVFFDLDGDGYDENVGWVAADDAFLVIDLGGDGVIDRADEIVFTENAALPPGSYTDLEALALLYDANSDGKLTSADAAYGDFRLWQDIDQDGVSDAGELISLADAGLSEIDLAASRPADWTASDLAYLGITAADIGQWTTQAGDVFDAAFLGNGGIVTGLASATINGVTHVVGDIGITMSTFGYQLAEDGSGNITTNAEDGTRILSVGSTTGSNIDLFTAGFDAVYGNIGVDVLTSSGASDIMLFGDAGDDELSGGSGDDWLIGGAGVDRILGGDGDDTLFIDAADTGGVFDLAADTIQGGDGNDIAAVDGIGGVKLDLLAREVEAAVGNAGDDEFRASADAASTVAVYLDGRAGNDILTGAAGGDFLVGGAGADQLFGGDGDDLLVIDRDDLQTGLVRGGAGTDVAILASVLGATFTLSELEVETAIGGSGNDTISVGAAFDGNIFGGGGDDVLAGHGGDDILAGGAGADTLQGGAGDDAYIVRSGHDVTTIDETAGSGTLDWILFDDSDSFAQLDFVRDGDDLRFSILGGASDGIVVGQFANGGASPMVEYLRHSDSDFVRIEGDGTGEATDDILAGTAGADSLSGVDGNDVLYGNTGDDTLNGGAGDDWLKGGAGADTLTGGTGIDTASYGGSDAAVVVDLIAGTGIGSHATGDTLSGIENLTGSAFNDSLTGDAGANVLDGGAGSDLIDGAAGVDTVSYARSDAAVTVNLATAVAIGGDAEGDILSGIENLVGSEFNDDIVGNGNGNTIQGGSGDDSIGGGAGNDTLRGGSGNDRLSDGVGRNIVDGGSGYDIADYSDSSSAINATFQDPQINPNDGDYLTSIEEIIGSPFDDSISGLTEVTTNPISFIAHGGAGNDGIMGDRGSDTLYGGEGDDHIEGSLGLYAESGDDQLTGGGGDDVLQGWAGDDTYHFERSEGEDRIVDYGGGGKDIQYGGIDTLRFGAGILPEDILMLQTTGTDLSGNTGIPILNIGIGSGDDPDWTSLSNLIQIQIGTSGGLLEYFMFEKLEFEDGQIIDISGVYSWISGTTGNDTITGTGNDSWVLGGGNGDWIQSHSGDDLLSGGVGNDVLQAGAGHDTLTGEAGDDFLLGGAGSDTLVGGAGNDWLKGGDGADVFSFDGLFGNEVIADFETGVDQVTFIGYAASDAALSHGGGDTIVDLGTAGSVTLASVTVESLDVFFFV